MRRYVLFSLLALTLSAPAAFAADPVADADQAQAAAVTTLAAADGQAGPIVTSRLVLPAASAVAAPVAPAASASQDTPVVRQLPAPMRKGFDARRPLLFGLYGVSASLQAYDGYTTLTALNNYHGSYELNPAMKRMVEHPGKFLAMKAATAAVSIGISEMLWQRNHKVLAVASMLLSNSLMAAVAAHNTAAIAELERR